MVDLVSRDAVEYRAARVSSVTAVSTFLAVTFQLISVPICLKYWGKESYGAWLSLYAGFMLVRALDIGFVSYVGNMLNYLYHQDQSVLREHLASSIVGIAIIGAVQLSIGGAALFTAGVPRFLGISSGPGADHRSAVALLVLVATWVLSGSYLGIVHRLLIPSGFMFQAAWWAMGFQVCQFVGVLLAAFLHLDMFQTSVLFAFIQLAVYMASAVYVRRRLPAYYPWWHGWTPSTGFKDLGRSVLLTVSNLVQQASTNGTVLLVSALASPGIVPVFTTVRTLANLWTNVTNVLTAPLLPDVVRYHAAREGRKLVSMCEVHWEMVGSIVNMGILLTYPWTRQVYGYWTTHAVPLDKSLLCLLLASIAVTNVGALIATYLNGINSLGVVLTATVVRGAFSLGVGAALFSTVGLAGLGLGVLLGELLALVVMGRHFVRHELSRLDVSLPLRSLAPVMVSTLSTLVFLVCEGFALPISRCVYFASLLGVAAAALCGWKGLEPHVTSRLVRLLGDPLARRQGRSNS